MKATIDREGCIGCGLCADTCPDIFSIADDGKAEAEREEIPEDDLESAQEARDGCPVSVISLED